MFISHILRGWACEVSVLAWSGSGVVKLWQGPSSWLVGSASSHKAERALVSLSLKGYQSYPAPSPDLIPIQSPPRQSLIALRSQSSNFIELSWYLSYSIRVWVYLPFILP